MILYQALPNFTTSDSLFQKMVGYGAPWPDEVAQSMDRCFITMYSGLKEISSFVKLNMSSGTVDTAKISRILWDMYGRNWQKLWGAYLTEYNPLNNYNLTEKVERGQTDERIIGKTGSLSSKVESSGESNYDEDGTNSLKHGEVIDTTGEVTDSVFAFNSTAKAPAGVRDTTSSETHSGTDETTTHNEGIDNSSSTTTRTDTTKDDTTDNDTLNETINRTRQGNIGQNSYQELLQQDFELWKWNFFWQVFEDCDKLLCLSVFDPCQSISTVD